MALKSVTKMLSQRLFPGGTRGGTETSKHITDENLRSLYAHLKQDIAEVNQLTDEFHAIFALKRAVTRDRIIWSSFILSVGFNVVQQFEEIMKSRNAIKDKESQLSARSAEKQELRLPALAA
ncbi:hypothetical protein C5167_035335 [Papaver somniferum]|uniref:Uncharacterized protein n=1 Tax=Papaver somniferum TaxID=3469 RepID=A0A4Y7KJC4_PAPSO|nr:uncharacterized protein LOC113293689 [Papaver somniferum]RZC72168.1 hypothetical protein C5167_035335 [Papaver somniferum]